MMKRLYLQDIKRLVGVDAAALLAISAAALLTAFLRGLQRIDALYLLRACYLVSGSVGLILAAFRLMAGKPAEKDSRDGRSRRLFRKLPLFLIWMEVGGVLLFMGIVTDRWIGK